MSAQMMGLSLREASKDRKAVEKKAMLVSALT